MRNMMKVLIVLLVLMAIGGISSFLNPPETTKPQIDDTATPDIGTPTEPEPEPEWHTITIYSVKSVDTWQSSKFKVPEGAEKIRLTFDITVGTPSGQYVLMGTLLDEKNQKWQFQASTGLSKTFEFSGVSGSVNLTVLMNLASAKLKVEWYGIR